MMMKQSVVVLGAVLLCCLTVCAYHGTYGPDECCFHFYQFRLPKDNVDNYRVISSHCTNKGIIVTMQNGKEFCVDPTKKWVKDITNLIDQKRNG